jgi:hypothetical protein
MEISSFMSHANPITLGIEAHLLEDDHEPAMSAAAALSRPTTPAVGMTNVISPRAHRNLSGAGRNVETCRGSSWSKEAIFASATSESNSVTTAR